MQTSEKQYCQKMEHVIKSASTADLHVAKSGGAVNDGDGGGGNGEVDVSAMVVDVTEPAGQAATTDEDGHKAGTT